MAMSDCDVISDFIIKIMIVFDIICYGHYDSAIKFDLSFNFKNIQYGFETESKIETLMQ